MTKSSVFHINQLETKKYSIMHSNNMQIININNQIENISNKEYDILISIENYLSHQLSKP